MKRHLLLFALGLSASASAQVKIGNNPAVVDAASLLELEHPNKALYLNRAALTSTTDVITIPTPKAGMVVYNTNAGITGTAANPAVAGGTGVYYYDGARWVGTGLTTLTGTNGTTSDTTFWRTNGNAGTSSATNFIGTRDSVDFSVRTNNTEKMRVQGNGLVGIGLGTAIAQRSLHIGGSGQRIEANGPLLQLGSPFNNGSTYIDFFPNSYANARGGVFGFPNNGSSTLALVNQVPNGGLSFSTNNIQRLSIDGSGNMQFATSGLPFVQFNIQANIIPLSTYTNIIGSSSNYWANIYSSAFTTVSDARLKTGVTNIDRGLNTIMALRPVRYAWKAKPEDKNVLGFIAQEVEKVVPEVVTVGTDSAHTYGVKYSELVPVLTKAIQEQQGQIEDLKATAVRLNAENEVLKAQSRQYAGLEERLTQLEQAATAGKSTAAQDIR